MINDALAIPLEPWVLSLAACLRDISILIMDVSKDRAVLRKTREVGNQTAYAQLYLERALVEDTYLPLEEIVWDFSRRMDTVLDKLELQGGAYVELTTGWGL